MASLDSLQVRSLSARKVIHQTVDDTPVALRLRYVGTGTVTSVTVTSATNLVTVTSDGGTDTYTFATYTTLGALADAINTAGIFEARILDGIRADDVDATSVLLPNGAITAYTSLEGYLVWDVLVDTSVAQYASVSITPDANKLFEANRSGHRVTILELAYYENVSAAEAGAVRIYSRPKSNQTESLIWKKTSVDATITTLTWASGLGGFTGQNEMEYVFRVFDTTSITDAAGNFVQVAGICE